MITCVASDDVQRNLNETSSESFQWMGVEFLLVLVPLLLNEGLGRAQTAYRAKHAAQDRHAEG